MSSSLSDLIPILPRLTSVADGSDSSGGREPNGVVAVPQPAHTASNAQSAAAVRGREADKRPAPKGLYDLTATPAASHAATASTATTATTATTTASAATGPDTPHSLHSPSRLSVSSSGLVAFHRQLVTPLAYSDVEAIRLRADIEEQYVHFLRCWRERAAAHIQQTTGAVNPLIEAHSKLQQSFGGQHAAAVNGDSKPSTQLANAHSTAHSHTATSHRHTQQRQAIGSTATASLGKLHDGGSNDARQHRDNAVTAAAEEVRKSVRKRRPPKLLAEDDADDAEHERSTALADAKRQRHGERTVAAAEERMTEERQQRRGAHTVLSDGGSAGGSGEGTDGRRTAADVLDEDMVVVDESSTHSQPTFANRPRRTATATRKRDVLLTHHFFRHFSLRCYSISNPPQPPPSSSASPPNCQASVNYRLYMQSQAILKAQFPKIGRADQPSTSYYACLCVEPVSPYYRYCASLLPPRMLQAAAAVPADECVPLVLSSSLFDLCDGLYFRILFFTSPYATNGFATLLLAHLRLLAVRLSNRLIVCATKAQKEFWISCGFRDAAQHWGGLNFGDTMLLACELMEESREEEQRRRMAYKSEERLRSKVAAFNSRAAVATVRRQSTTVVRHSTTGVRRADNDKRARFYGADTHDTDGTAQQLRDKQRSSSREVIAIDPKRAPPASTRPARPTLTLAGPTLFSHASSAAVDAAFKLASVSASPSASDAVASAIALDPLTVYHPYIVRSLRYDKLLPIRGPPLACPPSTLPSFAFVTSAAVMCVTQQSAYHKGGAMLVTFTLQRGTLLERQHRHSVDGAEATANANNSATSSDGATIDNSSRAGGATYPTDERMWRVRLIQGKRGGGTAVELAEQLMYPLGEGWGERYGLPPMQHEQQNAEDVLKCEDGTRAVKHEDAEEAEDDDSGSEASGDIGSTRRVPELIDLVDDSDHSNSPTPDPLSEPQQQQQQHQSPSHNGHEPSSEQMEDDEANGAFDDRSLPFEHSDGRKLLSTPTLHAAADTETPSSPLALPLQATDEPYSPEQATSPSPSPSPTLPSSLTASHTARLQLILPLSPAHTQLETDSHSAEHDGGTVVGAEAGEEAEEADSQPGQPSRDRATHAAVDAGVPRKHATAYLASSVFAGKAEGESGLSIFAMMS